MVPEASRRAPVSGSVRGEPSTPSARAGAAPTQATPRTSSPLRKRCERTPPVARPLAGNSVKADTLALPGSVPGRVWLPEAIVATTASSAASAARLVKNTTRASGPSLMPAIPPAVRPCGRTVDAGKRNSWASEATNTSSSSSAPWTAPTTSSPALSAMISKSGLFAQSFGVTRLTMPCRVPSAMARSLSSATRARTTSPPLPSER